MAAANRKKEKREDEEDDIFNDENQLTTSVTGHIEGVKDLENDGDEENNEEGFKHHKKSMAESYYALLRDPVTGKTNFTLPFQLSCKYFFQSLISNVMFPDIEIFQRPIFFLDPQKIL